MGNALSSGVKQLHCSTPFERWRE